MTTKISQEDFLSLVKNDKLKNLTFIFELTSNNTKKIKLLSKATDTVVSYDAPMALIKLNDIYNAMTGNSLNIRVDDLKNHLIKVDIFNQSYFEKKGLSKRTDDINIYNYYVDTDIKKTCEEKAKLLKKGTYEEVMDFTKYPSIACLLDNVFDPSNEMNTLYTSENEKVNPLEYNCKWLNFVFTSKMNASTCPVIISLKHGVGKGLYTKMLQEYHGKYAVRLVHDAFKSEFNGILQNKALTIYDEARSEEKVNNVLKGLIGNSTYNARAMFSEREEKFNGNNFIITGNKGKVPVVYVEPEDRRFITFYSKEQKIEQAVAKMLSITFEQFLKNLEREKVDFFTDILRIDCDYNTSGHTHFTNKVKKILIKENFGEVSSIIEAIKTADIVSIEDELFDKKHVEGYDDLIKEINAGYLTKSSTSFIVENYDNDLFKKDLKKKGLIKFWDDEFGKAVKITANGTSFMARKLENFDRSKLDVKKKNDVDTDFSDFDTI